jgi:hypothetical protein
MPGSDDDFDQEAAAIGLGAPLPSDTDAFDQEAASVGLHSAPAPLEQQHEGGFGHDPEGEGAGMLRDAALGFGEGASLGHGKELGQLGEKAGSWFYSLLHPDQRPTTRVNGRDLEPDLYRKLGALEPGNVDLRNRPHVKNGDSISTIRSMGFQETEGGPEILIPTVSDDGRLLSGDEAIDQYYKTGRHLGKYATPEAGTAAGEALHQDQVSRPPRNTLDRNSSPSTNLGISDELHDRALATDAGKVGRVLGGLNTSIAAGGLAPAGVASQAAVGAGIGGLQAHGQEGSDWKSILLGAAGGGALGAGGALVGKGLSSMGARSPQNGWQGATVADDLLAKMPVGVDQLRRPWELPGLLAGQGAVRAGKALAPAAPAVARAGTALAPAGGAVGGYIGTALAPSKAKAQEKAYATPATASWAVQSVLTSGDTGLRPQDEQRLTEAVMSGDEDRVIAANFALQQSNPMYGRKIQQELEALQEQ